MYKRAYAEINLKNIEDNVKKITTKLADYSYHFGVVKADSYGHDGNKTVLSVINGGCNYLAVATFEEAIEIRKDIKDIPILVLGYVDENNFEECIKNNITITVSSYDYVKLINKDIKVHIKINTGMNRLGINNRDDFLNTYNLLKEKNIDIEGVYTHIYNDSSKEDTNKQIDIFKHIINGVDIPIVHIGASGYALNYSKEDFINGIRFGIAIYGLIPNDLNLKSTFSLHSFVMQINEVENSTVGYNGAYKVSKKEKIAVVPIGYADGIIRKNTGRFVYINNKRYKIVGNICMDMLFVKVDDSVNIYDKVTLIKDNEHIFEIANYLDTISYEVICSIGKRVPRIYK